MDTSTEEVVGIPDANIQKYREKFESDPKNLLAQNVCTRHDPFEAALKRNKLTELSNVFSHKISLEGKPVTNQKASGRCWIFALFNCMRVPFLKEYNIEEFEFSQTHIFFWDKVNELFQAQLIAQSIGQAFQVAYLEFLKANGIDDPGLLKEMDYQDVLNQQEIYGEELAMFTNRDKQKEVIVPKLKSEILGIVIVESGWGSMVPTVVIANMAANGPAARCGQLNIGDQIISINGVSLVGLPLSSCQNYIKALKSQTVVKLTVVSCPPVVEVRIKRPDVKYQLGFSVQNGVICSLLRGGIAERGGVRVGHRIIEINGESVVAVPHEKIVTLLANAIGELHMKTMPTAIYRLLTGQEIPHYI
ncbi:protein lin-10-like [Lingula anatina]|uniref:Protein lin-10-like n=1 Tax=Lingula anatina TaxID=7574 RepID=A0A1S3H379_LINAN|nr:protein lin-10-like [Lingula anatina]|eukprot:XP_013380407.2 protein lin-10-like [Lingula anatina]